MDTPLEALPVEIRGDPDLAAALADLSELGQYLRNLSTSGRLGVSKLRRVLKYAVPGLLIPVTNADGVDAAYSTSSLQSKIFNHMEDFLFEGKSYEAVALELKALDDPPRICGRVFKSGEPTYSCRECQMDRTCVLCIECFQHSEHRHHRYRISSSDGGGFCDCGDPEAWKSHPSCSLHAVPDAEQRDGSEILARMPAELVKRVELMLETCVYYCVEVLCKDSRRGPDDLELSESERGWSYPVAFVDVADKYVTLMFNDETHSYNLVMYTLTRAIDVSPKAAIDYATTVDQEGRCVIFVGTFRDCSNVKQRIEQLSQRDPLKTNVTHCFDFAHEIFGHKLVKWMQRLTDLSNGFKKTLADLIMQRHIEDDVETMLVRILKHDSKLWKAARAVWHNLFISTMLMNFERRRRFAVVFTENYCRLLDDHVDDDQVPQSSIMSFSVQLYTVPSVAYHLIEDHSVLTKLFSTFMSGYEQGDVNGALALAKNKRSRVIFCDLDYLLRTPPTSWSGKLRCGFLYGFGRLVALLNQISGTYHMVRQVVNHVEFENDWESAIHMQFRLNPILRSVIKWCNADQVVYLKAFRMIADKRLMTHANEEKFPRTVAGHEVSVNDYDVSTQTASLHYPLPRMLAAFIQCLPRFELTWESALLGNERHPLPEYIEHPLRVKVLQAQVHAGMWRRNGLSLMKQFMFYINVRCRVEMHDRDLYLVQFAGSAMDPDEFLILVLSKFNLHAWADNPADNLVPSADDDRVHQINVVIEEMLGFLINVVSERHTMTVGRVTDCEVARKEVLQLLCMDNLPHSTLMKALPDEMPHETYLDEAVGSVATFRRTQTVTKKGVYELKPECWKEFNVFFHHYSREDQSKAEDNYRKMARTAGWEEYCVPPELVPLSEMFKNLANVMQCDVMLAALKSLFLRTLDLRCYIFTEAQLQKGLFLVGFALRQEELSLKPGANQVDFQFVARAKRCGLYEAFEQLSSTERLASHRGLYNWVLAKFKHVESLRNKDAGEVPEAFASVDTEKESVLAEKRMRKERADLMKNKIMAQMMTKQKRFMVENKTFYEACAPTLDEGKEEAALAEVLLNTSHQVAIGPNQSTPILHVKSYKCILCQETELLEPKGVAMVLCAYVQQSTVLSKGDRRKTGTVTDPSYALYGYEPAVLSSRLQVGPHVSSCGHVLHADCWRKQYEEMVKKENRRPSRQRLSFDVDRQEFLCPLCQRLSNTVVPLVAPLGRYADLLRQPSPDSELLPAVSMHSWDLAVTAAARLASLKWGSSGLISPEQVRRMELMNREEESSARPRNAPVEPVFIFEPDFLDDDMDDSEPDEDDAIAILANDELDADSDTDFPEELEAALAAVVAVAANLEAGQDEDENMTEASNGEEEDEEEEVVVEADIENGGESNAAFSPSEPELSFSEEPDDGRSKDEEMPPAGAGGDACGASARATRASGDEPMDSDRAVRTSRASVGDDVDGPRALSWDEREALVRLKPYYQPTRSDGGGPVSLLGNEIEGQFVDMAMLFAFNNYCTAYRKDRSRGRPYRALTHGVWAATSFTIHAVELELRDECKPILGNFTVRQLDTLSPLVKMGGLIAVNEKNIQRMIEMNRCLMDPLLLPYESTRINRMSFLHVDAFSVLVTLLYSQKIYMNFPRFVTGMKLPHTDVWPDRTGSQGAGDGVHVPRGDSLDLCAFRFALVLYLAQVLVLHSGAAPPDPFNDPADEWFTSSLAANRKAAATNQRPSSAADNRTGRCDALTEFVSVVGRSCKARGIPFRDASVGPVDSGFAAAMEVACRPFLRCCAMFAHFLTDVPPSAELTEVEGDTYKELACYVGLPPTLNDFFAEVMSQDLYGKWINRWLDYPGVKAFLSEQHESKLKPFAPLTLNRFIKLPDEFSELINRISTFRCPHDTDTRRYHTICLVCGTILCSPGYCCQVELDSKRLVGAATYHTRCCGAGTGVFLVVQNVQVLLMCGKNKGCNLPAPYLDEYGEPDTGLRRGNPLTLHRERYLELQRKWLTHAIPETTSAAMDNSGHFLSTDWTQL